MISMNMCDYGERHLYLNSTDVLGRNTSLVKWNFKYVCSALVLDFNPTHLSRTKSTEDMHRIKSVGLILSEFSICNVLDFQQFLSSSSTLSRPTSTDSTSFQVDPWPPGVLRKSRRGRIEKFLYTSFCLLVKCQQHLMLICH